MSQEKMAEIVMRTWTDEEFADELRKDALNVLKSHGFQIPDNVREVRIVENTDEVVNVVIPTRPGEIGRINEDQLYERLEQMLSVQLVLPTILED